MNILQYSQKTPVLGSLFNKAASLQARNFLKKRFQHRCFLWILQNFKDYLFWKTSVKQFDWHLFKHFEKQLLPDYFNGSLIHRPNGLRFILYDSARLQGPWPSFLFCFILFFHFFVFLFCTCPEPNPDLRLKIYDKHLWWVN